MINTNSPEFFKGEDGFWFSPLIQRLAAGYLSGNNIDEIKEKFIKDFSYFMDSPDHHDFLFPLTKDDAVKVAEDAIKRLTN